MTPFMAAVAEVLSTQSGVGAPDTTVALPRSIGEGADHQVMIRSMAEQMVCEANAVLGEHDERIELEDEAVNGQLRFTLRYRDQCAEVSTTFDDRIARSRFRSEPSGRTSHRRGTELDRELADPQAVADLILALIAGAPLTKRHPMEA
jgi:hypothetical protein